MSPDEKPLRPDKNPLIITIDGPAGSGKSTIAAQLAQRLGVSYLDTGAMYRAITLAALEQKLPLDNPAALESLTRQCRMEFSRTAQQQRIWCNGKDVTDAIRAPEVTNHAHFIAKLPNLRKLLVEQQRRIAQEVGPLVTEGRDQGTVVFPDAAFKFYLDAEATVRARRRCRQLQEQGIRANYEEILADQQKRDQRDSTRSDSPLMIPPGAIVIDTTDLTIEQVIDNLLEQIKHGSNSVKENPHVHNTRQP